MKRRLALVLAAGAALLAACTKRDEAPPAPAPPDPERARRLYEQVSQGSGFVVGEAMAARSALVFFDPQCPHCAALWQASKPLLGRLRMVWLPVAFISPSSAPQGALLLSAADPATTMEDHEARLAAGQGGLPVPAEVPAAGLEKVKANTALWKSIGATSVPYMVFRAGSDGPYGVQSGAATTEQLAALLGL